MSFSEQTNQRENTTRRPRNNHSRNNQRQWVPRGSVPATTTTVNPIPTADSSSTNSSGNANIVNPTNHPTRPILDTPNHSTRPVFQTFNRNHFGSRGNPSRNVNHHREKAKESGTGSNRKENAPKVSKNVNIPQLVQEIQEKLLKGSVECMICYDMVRRSAPIWSCSSCYSIFHLSCIKKWARAPTSVDLLVEKNQGFNWRCPGCQSVQLVSSKEIRYICFCGKRPDPPSDLYLTPHSCGESCGRKLEKELHGNNGASKEDVCPHVCVLQCHPGPCPPCKAFAPPRKCPCGKKVITTRCSDVKSVLTCGEVCHKLLDCGRHYCENLCHVGPCDPCQVPVNASCFCKKTVEVVSCGDMAVKGEVKVEDGVFSCNSFCEKKLTCGNHVCKEICHPGSCGDCEFSPSKISTCCCGKTALKEERNNCLDPIETCPNTCYKLLPCKLHHCQETCHPGTCPPCLVLVTQTCRCGSTTRSVECDKTTSDNNFTCEKSCGRKKNCGRHRCSEKCCPLSNPNISYNLDWDPHLCSMPCEKKLRCGNHSCTSLCHIGHCPPCLETIFTDLTCACGRTSIPPPLPCGTPHPSCQHPCSVPQPCGHFPASHTCHFSECPPCSVPVAKECVGGHVILRNIPCGSKDIRCNKLCGKTRKCGLHACNRTCHTGDCDSGSGNSCGQICGAPRRDCKHTCTSLCHPSGNCPDVRCEFPVTISCSCGRITASVPCDSGGSGRGYNGNFVHEAAVVQKLPVSLQPIEGEKIPLGQRKLMCDDECAKVERKKVLADAFDVSLGALHIGENPSEILTDLLRRDSKWVFSVEERCKYLVLGRGRGVNNTLKVHVFCVMTKDKRDAVRVIAERWKLSINAAGWEPKRFVVVHVTHKSKTPARVLGVKSLNPSNNSMLQPPFFDPLIDMDPRLVVALFDMPRDADISALVLRFGGECELVWLNDKNALSVFSDPARAATAMRRLDQGSTYYGAVVHQTGGGSSGGGAWGQGTTNKEVGTTKGNPWKKEGSWGAEEGSFGNFVDLNSPVWKGNEAIVTGSGNRWSVLDTGSTSRSTKIEEKTIYFTERSGLNLSTTQVGSEELSRDVVDDWEKVCD